MFAIVIEWAELFSNSVWIIGLAIGLSTLSVAYWYSQRYGKPFKEVVSEPKRLCLFHLAGLLFCVGVAGTSNRWWKWALWELLVFIIGFRIWKIYLTKEGLT